MGEKGEGIKKYELMVTKQSWDVKYRVRNIDNHIVIIVYGARWVLELLGESLNKLYKCLTTILYTILYTI